MMRVGVVAQNCLRSLRVSAVSRTAFAGSSVVFRSILPGREPIRIPGPHGRRSPSHWSSAVRFVGHLVITAFVFLSFVTVVWSVSFAFAVLQSANPLSEDALRVFGVLESVLIRVDAGACGIVLIFGITKYVLNVMKGDS